MQLSLADFLRGSSEGAEATSILRACVHCGFCTATCPTYQVLGDELDGPRGRIYLIKQALEGVPPGKATQLHLDRCLTCHSCETTCPSGVKYVRLLDIGRAVVEARVPRPLHERVTRALLRTLCTGPLFGAALGVARALRPVLPAPLREHIPRRRPPGAWPRRRHTRRMLLLAGCVQPAMAPNINAATARVLDALGVELVVPPAAGCCGAIRQHLGDQPGALAEARRNIDAWWPHIEGASGTAVEAIVMNASGCGAQVQEYAHLLRHDPAYAAKAQRIAALSRDLAQLLSPMLAALRARLRAQAAARLVFHPPCTLQHALGLRGTVEPLLRALGAEILAFDDSHLCCGSAGTYSLTQRQLSHELRERKLRALMAAGPEAILSANVGCIAHLAARASIPVQHWIEWLDGRLDYDLPP
jgi:glycolate oxidase iron-sulfur subunit